MLQKYKYLFLLFLLYLITSSCSSGYYVRNTFSYPTPVNTKDKKIQYQIKKLYHIDDIYADNLFDAARMNNFSKINDSTFQVNISPENIPINDSPWYAFRIRSEQPKRIYLQLKYTNGHHRYIPKISRNREIWKKVDTAEIRISKDRRSAIFPLKIDSAPTWVSAQKIINSTDLKKWLNKLKNRERATEFSSIGKSELGREIHFFRIGKGSSKEKKVILLMSRQHPPEVTGFLALEYFIDELLSKHDLSDDFYQKYDIWVFPLLNPDGVDLGHWRHNANGVDLNRDWAYFRQAEINTISQFIVNRAKKYHNKVVLGIDFHSTIKDIYYVCDDSFKTSLPGLKKYWTQSIDQLMGNFQSMYAPSPLDKPVSKAWFYLQFGATGMTYEVGDQTPEKIIEKKARIAVVTLMDLLINYPE